MTKVPPCKTCGHKSWYHEDLEILRNDGVRETIDHVCCFNRNIMAPDCNCKKYIRKEDD